MNKQKFSILVVCLSVAVIATWGWRQIRRGAQSKAGAEHREPAKMKSSTKRFSIPEYGLTGMAPATWIYRREGSPEAGELTLYFTIPDRPGIAPRMYCKFFDQDRGMSAQAIQQWLEENIQSKSAQRVQSGLTDYKVRPKIVSSNIRGRPAISWSADFTKDNVAWTESLTRIYSPKSTALFFLIAPSKEVDSLIDDFTRLIEDTVLP